MDHQDELFTPYQLETLANIAFCEGLNDASKLETIHLPLIISKPLQSMIKDVWMWQKSLRDTETYLYEDIDVASMSRIDFNMLMNQSLVPADRRLLSCYMCMTISPGHLKGSLGCVMDVSNPRYRCQKNNFFGAGVSSMKNGYMFTPKTM